MTSPNQLSFLPDDYLERKQRRRTNVICASLFVVVVGSVFAAWMMTRQMLSELETSFTATESQYAEAAKRIDLVRQMQDKQRTMAGQAELTASLLERVPRSHLLAEITNAMPAGLSLLEFDMTSKVRQPPPPPPPPPGSPAPSAFDAAKTAQATNKVNAPRQYDVTIKLTGVAANDVQVAGFITKLGQSKLVRDVNLVISEEHALEGQKVRKFAIEMSLDPTARVLNDGKTERAPLNPMTGIGGGK
jgi:Tfp pilus assembly protein PilN